MDHLGEQEMEVEALQSIYPDSITVHEPNHYSITLTPTCTAADDDEQDQEIIDDSSVTLTVKYTSHYPEEAPEIEITVSDFLDTLSFVKDVDRLSQQICRESLGMAMIFSVTSSIQEHLDTHVQSLIDTRHREQEERKKLEEERDNAKFIGTPVTRDSFLDWRRRFDQETALLNAAKLAKIKLISGKLTGKQLFEHDAGLALSDAKYIEEGGVAVDTSLFEQELENLDLEDNDADYVALEISDSD